MKKVSVVFSAAVMVIGMTVTSDAATSLVGTWAGTGSCATNSGFVTLAATVNIVRQNSAGLFRGTVSGSSGADILRGGITGYISGTQVRMNNRSGEYFDALWDFTYVAATAPTLRGYVRAIRPGSTCTIILMKQ